MEIKEKFDAPFGPIPALRLTTVPRWPIIKMDTEQSVAEHVFNVIHITKWLYNNINYKTTNKKELEAYMHEAFHHDDVEVWCSDIPSPAKKSPNDTSDLVKLADLIEAYRFFDAHCIDTDKIIDWLRQGLKQKIYNQIQKMGISYTEISSLMES